MAEGSKPAWSSEMPERSSAEESRPPAAAVTAEVSMVNARLSASWSTVNILRMSKLSCDCRSSSNALPVNTSTSRLACCSRTICELAARRMSSCVSAGVYATPSFTRPDCASPFGLMTPTILSLMPFCTCCLMYASSSDMSVHVPWASFLW